MRSIFTTVCSFLALTLTIWGFAASDASARRGRVERVIFFGDSIVAGYGLSNQDEALPQQVALQAQKQASNANLLMIPMGVSGDTTSSAVARIPDVLAQQPDIVIIAFGGNDMLRGIDPDITYNNLDVMLKEFQRAGVYVLFCGMQAPPNLGSNFQARFNHVFPELAERHQVTFYPFLLDGVFNDRALMQRDGLHPSKEGVAVIAKTIGPIVGKMVTNVTKSQRQADMAQQQANAEAAAEAKRLRRAGQ